MMDQGSMVTYIYLQRTLQNQDIAGWPPARI